MKNRLLKILAIILIVSGLISAVPLVFSQYGSLDEEINDLNLKIQNQKKQLEELEAKQKEYQGRIAEKQRDRINLSNQLSILEDRLAKAELDIQQVNLEISKANLEVKKIEVDSADLDEKVEEQKQHLSILLRLVYKQDQVSTLEMLLLNNSLTEFLNQAKYLEDANEEISASVEDLRKDKIRLDQNKLALEEKQKELVDLKTKLEQKKNGLAYEQENKTYILNQTRSSEKEYQNLLAQAKRQQEQIAAEIISVERLIRQKMSEKDKKILEGGNNTIAWPVPQNYIVSTFHDPDYPYRHIIGEHSAVDIRAAQGTTLMAAADGYVAKVRFDGSKNYAYIMIIHGDGLATVYGHVSAAYVSPDQYVTQGQIIGKTGGTPGTAGSGPFSTGPHLHFEVRREGLPVDPLDFLP